MRARSENVEAAERYLASRQSAGRAVAPEVVSPARARRRSISPAGGAQAWQRIRDWLTAFRLRPASGPRRLSVVERLDLGPKKSLWIVAYGLRRFLVADGAETTASMLEIGSAGSGYGERIPVLSPERWMAD